MISETTRRDIFDALRVLGLNWAGRLSETDFLARIFDLKQMPSYDPRFKNAAEDIWQHRINNPHDWDDDWVFADKRLNLLRGDDEIFLRFLCEMIHPVVRKDRQEIEKLRQLFNECLSVEGYEIIERSRVSGYPVYSARRKVQGMPLGVQLARQQRVLNAEYLSLQLSRIETAISNDPDLALGSSKDLVEACCKTILQERGVAFDSGWELTRLVKETYRQLKLTPDDIPETAKAAKTIKRLLSNLASVVQTLAELRNLYGTGHGKSAKSKGLTPRHAKLAAGAATALAVFLFETDEARNQES